MYINDLQFTVSKFVMAFTNQSNLITHSCWFAVTMGVGVLRRHQRWALHWWRLQGHVYGPCKWRFRRTPTPMEECTYSELILLCTFELEHCCFALKMCDISTAPHTRSTNGKYFEHIEFNDPWICCAEFVLWYVVMNLCILICGDVFVTLVHLRLPIAQWVYWWAVTFCVVNLLFCVRQPFEIGSLKIFTEASNVINIINIP